MHFRGNEVSRCKWEGKVNEKLIQIILTMFELFEIKCNYFGKLSQRPNSYFLTKVKLETALIKLCFTRQGSEYLKKKEKKIFSCLLFM